MKRISVSLGTSVILTLVLFTIIQPASQIRTEYMESPGCDISQEFSSARILFDESHIANSSDIWAPGNASLFSWMLGIHGYNSSTNFYEPLDSGILDNYDILAIFLPQTALSAGEVAAIHSFVDNGGGLLLVGVDNENTGYGFTAAHLNPISEPYGITFTESKLAKIYDEATFISHHLGQGDIRLTTNGVKMYACSLDVSGSATSISSDAEGTLVAIAEPGQGKVVCVGGPAPFYMYRREVSETRDYERLLFQFSLNVIDWLTGNDYREVTIPEIATLTVGNGPALSPSEVEEYTLFVGSTHVHTDIPDGMAPPLDQVEEGLRNGLEFIGFADHIHNVPSSRIGIDGGLEARDHIEANNFDMTAIIGAELSSVIHTVGVGLTENIYTTDQQTAVDEIHAQGALAVMAHPPYGAPYGPVYANRHVYGYDAIEVASAGYFYGIGEAGFTDCFYTGSDSHHISTLTRTLTGIFVKNPSGPNGTISTSDVQQAILDKRILVLDKLNAFVFGQKIWVDRFMEMWEEAKDEVGAARSLIDDMVEDGYNIKLSELYVHRAEMALKAWSVSKALKLASNATSSLALGIDLNIPSGEVVEPDTDFEYTISMTNNHSFGVSCYGSLYDKGSIQVDSLSEILSSPAEGVGEATWEAHTNPNGLIPFKIHLHSFNTSQYLMPLLIRGPTIIDNVTTYVNVGTGGYDVEFRFNALYPISMKFSSAYVYYNDGSGETQEKMDRERNYFVLFLESIPANTNITFYIELYTYEGDMFVLPERVVSTPGTQPFVMPDMFLIVGAIGAVVVVIVIIVLVKKRK